VYADILFYNSGAFPRYKHENLSKFCMFLNCSCLVISSTISWCFSFEKWSWLCNDNIYTNKIFSSGHATVAKLSNSSFSTLYTILFSCPLTQTQKIYGITLELSQIRSSFENILYILSAIISVSHDSFVRVWALPS
jgi:hypothetical protein